MKSYNKWLERSKEKFGNKGRTSIITWPWMRGFIDLVGGNDIASYLLRDAGIFPHGYNAKANIQDWNNKTYSI
jgi:hypothetical protein